MTPRPTCANPYLIWNGPLGHLIFLFQLAVQNAEQRRARQWEPGLGGLLHEIVDRSDVTFSQIVVLVRHIHRLADGEAEAIPVLAYRTAESRLLRHDPGQCMRESFRFQRKDPEVQRHVIIGSGPQVRIEVDALLGWGHRHEDGRRRGIRHVKFDHVARKSFEGWTGFSDPIGPPA